MVNRSGMRNKIKEDNMTKDKVFVFLLILFCVIVMCMGLFYCGRWLADFLGAGIETLVQ